MKIRMLYEDIRNERVFFKCLTPANLKSLKQTRIPGFLGSANLTISYADPWSNPQPFQGSYVVAILVDMSKVTDMSSQISDMSDPDGSGWSKTHPELRDEIWTARGSAHGDDVGIYHGQPTDSKIEVIDFIKDEDDFNLRWQNIRDKMQSMEN